MDLSGNSRFSVSGLRWSEWSSSQAVGRGRGLLKTCEPDCRTGKILDLPIQLTLADASGHCDDKTLFARLEVEWTNGAPPTSPRDLLMFDEPPVC
jgi:hypothetical protein